MKLAVAKYAVGKPADFEAFAARQRRVTPDGTRAYQDKLQLTGFESAAGIIAGGDELKVFDFNGARFGVAVCYDSEFPLPVHAQRDWEGQKMPALQKARYSNP